MEKHKVRNTRVDSPKIKVLGTIQSLSKLLYLFWDMGENCLAQLTELLGCDRL